MHGQTYIKVTGMFKQFIDTKGRGEVVAVNAMKRIGVVELLLHFFLTSILFGNEPSASCYCSFKEIFKVLLKNREFILKMIHMERTF